MSSNFKQLLKAALAQPQPQRLLFLLAKTELDKKSNKDMSTGTISPVMCVDKLPSELTSISAFIKEADGINNEWDFMLIAGLNGKNDQPPTSADAEPLLNKMANDLVQGQELTRYLILDRQDNRIELT